MDRANYRVKDASLAASFALPASNAATNSAAMDLGAISDRGGRLEACELEIIAPALATAALPDTKTMTYSVQSDSDSAFGSPATIADAVIVQTGAGSAGTNGVATTVRFGIPSNCERYLRVKATPSTANAGNAAGSSCSIAILF